MKRAIVFLLTTAIALSLCACGQQKKSETLAEVNDLSDATITVPAAFIGDEADKIANKETSTPSPEQTEEYEFVEAPATSEVTYELTGEERTEIVNTIATELKASIDAVLADKYYYPNVDNITVTEDGTEFTIYLTCDQPNLYESTLMMSFYTVGNKYQIYNGVPAEAAKTTVVYINSQTGKELARTDSTNMVN